MNKVFGKVISFVLVFSSLISILSVGINVNAYSVCDLNCDGKVNSIDNIIMQTIVVGSYGNASASKRADVNGDSKVNAVDASILSQILVGTYYDGKEIEGGIYTESAEAEKYQSFLEDKEIETKKDILVGIGSSKEYNIDFTDFENDGYIIRDYGSYVLVFGKTATGCDMAVRKYAKNVKNGDETKSEIYHDGYRVKELRIFGIDISEYTILVGNSKNGNQVFAAKELSRLLNKATGVNFKTDNDKTDAKYVIELRESSDTSLKKDGYKYYKEGNTFVIEGAVQRGAMYGVWRFLENELSWDALIYGDSILQCSDLIEIPDDIYKTETPGTYSLVMYSDNTPTYARFNNEKGTPKSGQSGNGVLSNCCHGMQSYMWSGVDVSQKQMCYTDATNIAKAKTSIRAYIESRLNAGAIIGYDFLAIDISQGDNDIFCQCKKCRAAIREDESQSGAVLRFANIICEDLEPDYPDLYVQIFAYISTKIPPKVTTAHKMVSVTFCYDFNCTNHPLDGSQCVDGIIQGVPNSSYGNKNQMFDEWLRGWANICSSIFVWEYALDAAMMSYPVIDIIREDFEYLYSLGVVDGIFWQCQNMGFGIPRIQYELCEQVLWNPQMTEEEYNSYYDKFLLNEYGDGWMYIKEYIDMWVKNCDSTGCWHCWGFHDAQWGGRLSADILADDFDRCLELFDLALENCNSEEQEKHITALSMSMIYEGVYGSFQKALKNEDVAEIKRLDGIYRICIERAHSLGIDTQNVRWYDGMTISYNDTLYSEAMKNWVGNTFDTAYKVFTKDESGNILYNGKIVWDGKLD